MIVVKGKKISLKKGKIARTEYIRQLVGELNERSHDFVVMQQEADRLNRSVLYWKRRFKKMEARKIDLEKKLNE